MDAAKTADKATDVAKTTKTFGGGKSTTSLTSKEAFRKTKEANGIPRSQQPNKTIKSGSSKGNAMGLNDKNIKQYEFTNSKGEKITIRQDKPTTYPDGGNQSGHFNAGSTSDSKLKQHHFYE